MRGCDYPKKGAGSNQKNIKETTTPAVEGLRGMDRKGKVIKKEQMVKRQVKKGMARKGMTAEVTKPLRRNKTSRVRNKNIKF